MTKSTNINFLLDKMHLGVVIIDRNKSIIYENSVATEILTKKDGLSSRKNQLNFSKPSATEAFDSIVDGLVNHSHKRTKNNKSGVQKILSDNGIQIFLTVIPLFDAPHLEHQHQSLKEDCQFAVILTSGCRDLQLTYDSLHTLFKITPAEYHVAKHLIKGWTQAEIADYLGKSRGTVKSNIDELKEKTGTSRQSELICLLSRCPAVLRLEE